MESPVHVTTAQCLDAIRGVLSADALRAVEAHIEGCRECAGLWRFWQRVGDVAARDAGFEPPADAVRTVQEYTVGRPQAASLAARTVEGLQALAATLTFDTFEQALPAGARAASQGARQLVFEVPPFVIDLRLEAVPRSGHIALAGQIAHADRTSGGGGHARIAVMSPTGEVAAGVANEFGEFQCEFEPQPGLKLSIALENGERIGIVLDRLPQS